ncbi:MAG: hypothetical protein IT270_04000 [Saprospiraceae bacterium]|nr:hypothetical protein [Saprospiraceae bacterium]
MHLILSIQPDIYIGGLRVAEPVIALTGLIIGSVSWYAYIRLGRIAEPMTEQRLMRVFFAFMAASAVIGAFFGHAFLYHFPFYFKLPGWVLSMVAASALERASIRRVSGWAGEKNSRFFLSLNIFKWFVFAGIVGTTVFYPVVQVHMAICMLLGLGLAEFYIWKQRKDSASRLLLLSIVPLLAAALIGAFKLSPSIWFAHEDVSHMFICVSLWLLMLGAENMQPLSPVMAKAA